MFARALETGQDKIDDALTRLLSDGSEQIWRKMQLLAYSVGQQGRRVFRLGPVSTLNPAKMLTTSSIEPAILDQAPLSERAGVLWIVQDDTIRDHETEHSDLQGTTTCYFLLADTSTKRAATTSLSMSGLRLAKATKPSSEDADTAVGNTYRRASMSPRNQLQPRLRPGHPLLRT